MFSGVLKCFFFFPPLKYLVLKIVFVCHVFLLLV